MTDTVRVPISVAAQRGISKLAADAADRRVILTNHGRAVAVVDNGERLDDDLRIVREASLTVIDAAAELVWNRSEKVSMEDVCATLGIDLGALRARRANG